MKVELLRPIGYCSGVISAIKKAKEIKKLYPNNNVYILGLLVHNERVIEELNNEKIISLDVNQNNIDQIIDKFKSDDIVIFTAHGHLEKYEELLKNKKITFFDTTCEKVLQTMQVIKDNDKNGIIYIGKKNHPETISCINKGKNVYLYDINEGLNFSNVKFKNPYVLNQSTLSFIELKKIHQRILDNIPNAIIVDEICDATRIRQEKIKNIQENYSSILIIGSNKSSNTKELYNIAKKYNSCPCYMVNSVEEVKKLHLKEGKILLASGTSTSLITIKEIKEFLEGLE